MQFCLNKCKKLHLEVHVLAPCIETFSEEVKICVAVILHVVTGLEARGRLLKTGSRHIEFGCQDLFISALFTY